MCLVLELSFQNREKSILQCLWFWKEKKSSIYNVFGFVSIVCHG